MPKISLNYEANESYIPSSKIANYPIQGKCQNIKTLTILINGQATPVNCISKSYSRSFDLSTFPDGQILIEVKATGEAGQDIQTAVLTKDTVAPTAALTLSGMGSSPSTNALSRTLSISSSEDDYFFKTKVIYSGTCATADLSLSSITTAKTISIPVMANRNNTVCVLSADRSYNWRASAVATSTISVDTLAPQLSFALTRAEVPTNTTFQVNWTLSETNPDPAENMVLEYSANGSAPWTLLNQQTLGSSPLQDQSYSYSWAGSPALVASGKLRLRYKDILDQETVTEIPVVVDDGFPVLDSIVLADGVSPIGLSTVMVKLTTTPALSSITHLRVSESNTFTGATWEPYIDGTYFFGLTSTSGAKTVYAQVRSGSGQVSNIRSANVTLEFGTPPSVVVTSPLSGTLYAPGTNTTISWTCSTTSILGLAASPISSIKYSVDDGISYHTIATNLTNNLTATTGSYSWTIPSTTPSGQTISSSKPMRVVVNCASAAGVISSGMSDLLNSSWKVLIGEPGNINDGIHISAADLASNSGFFGDSSNAIYYARKHAIMRMNPTTGLVSTWLGNMEVEGCNLASSGGYLKDPEILDISDSNEILIYSEPCATLYKVKISTKEVLWSRVLNPVPLGAYAARMYVKTGYLAYIVNSALYLLDLNSLTSTPEILMGKPGECGTVSAVGSDASQSLLPCATPTRLNPIITPDLKKIWITISGQTTRLLIKNSATGIYEITTTALADTLSRCVQVSFDSTKFYCYGVEPASTGRAAAFLNLTTGTRTGLNLSVYKNTGTVQLRTGAGKNSALYFSTTNELFEVRHNGTSWSQQRIGGQPFQTFGNGTDPKKVAFTNLGGMAYDSVNKWIYLRGALHLRRMHLNTTNPLDVKIDSIETALNTNQIQNSSAALGLAVSTDGARATVSNSSYHWLSLNLTSWNAVAESVGAWTSNFYRNSSTGTYPSLGEAFSTVTPYQIRRNQAQLGTFLPNGNFYFYGASDAEELMDLWIYESTGTGIKSIAGADGAAGYESGSHNSPALGSRLSSIHGMQPDTAGDLLVFDGQHLRKITVATEPLAPKLYDLVDFSTYSNYPGDLNWGHAVYDSNTGWSYFAIGADSSIGQRAQVWAARAAEGFVEIPTSGIILNQSTRRSLQFAITPAGLIMMDSNKKRLLQTNLKN